MSRLQHLRHAVPAALVAAVSLAVPLLGPGDRGVVGTAGSATARAAVDLPGSPAERFAVGSPAFTTARATADEHWGAAPCAGEVAYSWVGMEQGTNATATWRNPSDAWNNPGENFDCTIDLNATADYDFAKLCTVMAHEQGHLLGQRHDEQEGRLMSPTYTEALFACVARDPAPAESSEPAVDEPERAATAAVAPVQRAVTAKRVMRRTVARKVAGRSAASKRCKRQFSGRRAAGRGKVKSRRAAGRRAVKRCTAPKRAAQRVKRVKR